MAKTRRTKTNRSPGRPFRNSKAYIAVPGAQITTIGFRGRTKVHRVADATGKVKAIRLVDPVLQKPAKALGDRKPKSVFTGRQYTGVARSKPYPYRSLKRGAVPASATSFLGRAAKAVKRVVVSEKTS